MLKKRVTLFIFPKLRYIFYWTNCSTLIFVWYKKVMNMYRVARAPITLISMISNEDNIININNIVTLLSQPIRASLKTSTNTNLMKQLLKRIELLYEKKLYAILRCDKSRRELWNMNIADKLNKSYYYHFVCFIRYSPNIRMQQYNILNW